ncbi:fatty acid desaturase [Bordetella hinzii]|uniref:fatty acid desaturase n=1 Tax=Bordetella hinzii TaxID=103855 RepID=UPI0013EFED8C|nr:fatty acid desaturase [Bordetella hinzii]QII85523.1 fatty acid desaturase [Bordetella hinzii]
MVPRLRHGRDVQSLAYLALAPALAAWQWWRGFSWPLYGLLLFLTLGIGVIHHNHTHLRMWRGRLANRLTDFWITLLQGHPTFVFWPAHVANHHRYKHGARDAARTYRFGGDRNDLPGYLLHPFQAVWVLAPLFLGWLARMKRWRPGVWRYCLAQYAAWLALWGGLLAIDPAKALLFVILPQLHGLHWLLATNYLQHAHADGGPRAGLDYARNFEGMVNPLLFNIGLHTAHHENPRAHWTELARLHREHYRARVHPALNETGLLPYMARVFVLGSVIARLRSRPLMAPEHIR